MSSHTAKFEADLDELNRPRWISATVKPKLEGYDYRLTVPKTSIEDGMWEPEAVIAEAFNKVRNLSNYQQPSVFDYVE